MTCKHASAVVILGNQEQVGLEVALQYRDFVLHSNVERMFHDLGTATANSLMNCKRVCRPQDYHSLQTAELPPIGSH